ncbi:MAG: hypothetical protein LBT14_03205 [Treponema sp.]|nr:hypothetical protein [Treponema sp.]
MNNSEISVELEEKQPDDTPEAVEPQMVDPFDPTKIQISQRQDTLFNLINRLRNDEIDTGDRVFSAFITENDNA